jgi:wyosine [tRNA(Phe)-imidazoG37] synthetase (radical SAM superfamily)
LVSGQKPNQWLRGIDCELLSMMINRFVYGPVPSWRLGRSLGIDLISTIGKTCSFDCIYCQLGRIINPLTEREQFVNIANLANELEQVKHVKADYVTFSGTGEPTLASNLGEAIELTRSILRLPVAILTNSSLMPIKAVRQDLCRADVVVAKLDAPSDELFRVINQPVVRYSLTEILEGIKHFRSEYKGKLALQMMFLEANKDYAKEMAGLAKQLAPDQIQLNTPLRPCAVKPLIPEIIESLKREFSDLSNVITVYEAPRVETVPLSRKETQRRRPNMRLIN